MSERLRQFASKEPYLSFAQSITRERTRTGYISDLCHTSEVLGKPVHEATQDELEGYIKDCHARGLKGSTLSRYKASLAEFFKYEILKKHRLDDPSVLARSIDTGSANVENPKALSKEDRDKVLKSIDWEGDIREYQRGLAILFGFKLGFRRFEIAKVQWDDIDFNAGIVRVIGKGRDENEPEFVPLSKTITDKLKDYKMLVDKAGIDSRWVFFRNKGGPWPTDQNKHMDKENIYKIYKMIGRRCGFDMKKTLFSPHVGRHILVTTLYEGGADDAKGMKISRHKSSASYNKYRKINYSEVKDLVNKIID